MRAFIERVVMALVGAAAAVLGIAAFVVLLLYESLALLLVLVVVYAIAHGYRCWRRGERFWGEPGDY
jgi:hypothetical protein